MRNTTPHIQAIIATLEGAKFTNKDIYITYVDLENDYSSIDHSSLLPIMEDLGYPLDTIELVGNIYSESTTSFHGSHFTTIFT